jgi:peptidoglycan L-alanyl-D-glutamate endopeptidase CwlK
MINSRQLSDLLPPVHDRIVHFIAVAEMRFAEKFPEHRWKLQVLSTFRDNESQDALYAKGRTVPGPKVTNARGGYSWHNFHCAADVGILRDGQLTWERGLYKELGEIGKECGLTWGGDWNGDGVEQPGDTDLDHFQYTGGLTLADLRAGKQIEVA